MLHQHHWLARSAGVIITIALGLSLTACSPSGAGLSTSSLLPGKKSAPTDPATDRSIQVGATSARAQRCGYNFDAARLRSAYLAYESTQGGGADQLNRIERSYDYTTASIAKTIKDDENYCSDTQTEKIKKDLTRHLAGDFSAPAKPAPISNAGWWGSPSGHGKLDRDKIFDPMQRR